jgi:hypothetical protein
MHGVDLGVVVSEPVAELGVCQTTQMVLVGEMVEYPGRVASDVLWQRKHAVLLCERHRAKLARPVKDVLKDRAVECLEVK